MLSWCISLYYESRNQNPPPTPTACCLCPSSPPAAAGPPLLPLSLLSSAASARRTVVVGGTAKNALPPPAGGIVDAVLPAPDNSPTAAVELSCRRSPATSAIGLSLLRRRLLLSMSAVPACVLPAPPLVACVLRACAVILVVLRSVRLWNGCGGRHCKECPAAAGWRQWQRRPPRHKQRANESGRIITPPLPRDVNGLIIAPLLPRDVKDQVVPPLPAPSPVNIHGPVLAVPLLIVCIGRRRRLNYCAAAPPLSPQSGCPSSAGASSC